MSGHAVGRVAPDFIREQGENEIFVFGSNGRGLNGGGVVRTAHERFAARDFLIRHAARYERAEFLQGDPSWFMHQVRGAKNQEATAFVAANLSYGRRELFMQKIGWLLERSGGEMDAWIRSGHFSRDLPAGDNRCFYRLYTCGDMYRFLDRYRRLLNDFGTLGAYVRDTAGARSGEEAIAAICRGFGADGGCAVVPKNTQSACKRLCMFLRWMVRSDSPVDLGRWAAFIDRRTLLIPLDTHVLRTAVSLGLLSSRTASMRSARQLTARLAEIFPDDPLRGDFALFGAGIGLGAGTGARQQNQGRNSSVTGQWSEPRT